MGKTYKFVSIALVAAIVAYGGWRLYQARRIRRAGVLSEKIEHQGNLWTADFVARVRAPEPSVFAAIRDIEKSHSDAVKSVKVLSQSGDTKTVEMEMNGPAGQTITTELEFHYSPADHTIDYKTIGNPIMTTQAQYKLEDEGGSTLIRLHESTQMTQDLPVPDGVIKNVIRGVFVSQLESLKRTMNIPDEDQSASGDEEP
jgi:carbon monoxide dehydrogenase subunit G